MNAGSGTRIGRGDPSARRRRGRAAELFTLSREGGLTVRITNYAGAIVSILAPDRGGKKADVVLGFDSLPEYLADRSFQGALVGRYANPDRQRTLRPRRPNLHTRPQQRGEPYPRRPRRLPQTSVGAEGPGRSGRGRPRAHVREQ